MSKIAVVYWSGTGNTESMAQAVAQGVTEKGAEATVVTADAFTADDVANYDGFAFGCPSMGDEVLEECDFEPMWDAVSSALSGKNVVLFGSYGWGDGEWMRNWEASAVEAGITVFDTFICNDAPDADGEEACQSLCAKLV